MNQNRIDSLRRNLAHAERARDAAVAEINALTDSASELQIDRAEHTFNEAQEEFLRCKANLERAERAYAATQPPTIDGPNLGDSRDRIRFGGEASTYRPDREHSFFRDILNSRNDPQAQERLARNQREALDQLEKRDVTSSNPGATGFIPPIYLDTMWAEQARPDRPFADILPKIRMPERGLSLEIPKVQTGTAVEVQAAEANTVQETDIDTETVTANVVTIAGQNDISRQALERSAPGMDFVIFSDLMAAYDAKLDTQLLSGSGSSGQHLGIRNVTSNIDVTYTDASPTSAELLPKIYDAIQQVASNRYRPANVIVLHPRRAAWLASNLSSTFPLFQQGTLMQAGGEQAGGFVTSFGGLRVILDANIGTTYGASTNEDEIYVLHTPDLFLAEEPIRTFRFEDVLSGTLQVRLQVMGYSAFVPHRQPKSVAVISGSGLASPSF